MLVTSLVVETLPRKAGAVAQRMMSPASFILPDGEGVALHSASEKPAEAPDTVVFITNFFDELRRLTAAEGR